MQAPSNLPFTSRETEALRVNNAPVVPLHPGFAQKEPHVYISWHAVPSQRPRAVLSTGGERRVDGSLVRPQGVPALQQPGPISPGTTKCRVPRALSRLRDTRRHVLWQAVASGVTCKPPWAWAPRLMPSLERQMRPWRTSALQFKIIRT